jgi:hypothetical protein
LFFDRASGKIEIAVRGSICVRKISGSWRPVTAAHRFAKPRFERWRPSTQSRSNRAHSAALPPRLALEGSRAAVPNFVTLPRWPGTTPWISPPT